MAPASATGTLAIRADARPKRRSPAWRFARIMATLLAFSLAMAGWFGWRAHQALAPVRELEHRAGASRQGGAPSLPRFWNWKEFVSIAAAIERLSG